MIYILLDGKIYLDIDWEVGRGGIIKKKLFNNIMFWVSIVYLFGCVYLLIFKKIDFDWKNFFNTDGMALFGCIFALGQLWFSKKNYFTRKLNGFLIKKKYVNYRIDISSKRLKTDTDINSISNNFEEILINNLNIKDLRKKPLSKPLEDSLSFKYDNLGLEVKYSYERRNFYMTLKGKTQYGKLNEKNKDILYLNLLIEVLGSEFLQDKNFRTSFDISRIDVILKREGSQFKILNIFNEELIDVQDYNVKIIKDLIKNSEVYINKQEIKLSLLSDGGLIKAFMELTNIICNVD